MLSQEQHLANRLRWLRQQPPMLNLAQEVWDKLPEIIKALDAAYDHPVAQEGQDTPVSVLNGIRDALETRGYFHMANGRDIGRLLDAPEACDPRLAERPEWIKPDGDADRLWRAINGYDIDDFDKRAHNFVDQWMGAGPTVSGDRTQIKAALAQNFAQLAICLERKATPYTTRSE